MYSWWLYFQLSLYTSEQLYCFLKQFAVIASFGVQVIKRINDRSTRGSVAQTLLPSAMIGVCPVETGAIWQANIRLETGRRRQIDLGSCHHTHTAASQSRLQLPVSWFTPAAGFKLLISFARAGRPSWQATAGSIVFFFTRRAMEKCPFFARRT